MQLQISHLLTRFVVTVRFFSILPIKGVHQPPHMANMAPLIGPVSLLISLPSAAVLIICYGLGFSSLIAACLALVAHIIATGAMGEDAVGDSADAVFGGRDLEKKHAIFKDSRLGTFGVCAVGMLLLLHFSALSTMIAKSPLDAAAAIVAAASIARPAGLWQMVRLQPIFDNGLAAQVGAINMRHFVVGISVALVCALPFILYIGGVLGIIIVLLSALGVNFSLTRLWGNTVEGYCGDTIGASMRIAEVAILTLLSLLV